MAAKNEKKEKADTNFFGMMAQIMISSLFVLTGALMLFVPGMKSLYFLYVTSGVLLVAGAWLMFRFFLKKGYQRITDYNVSIGVLVFVFGVVVLIRAGAQVDIAVADDHHHFVLHGVASSIGNILEIAHGAPAAAQLAAHHAGLRALGVDHVLRVAVHQADVIIIHQIAGITLAAGPVLAGQIIALFAGAPALEGRHARAGLIRREQLPHRYPGNAVGAVVDAEPGALVGPHEGPAAILHMMADPLVPVLLHRGDVALLLLFPGPTTTST